MPFADVRLIPGIDREKTQTLNQAGYSFSSFIRWKEGLAQKIGGWIKFYNFAVGGVPRDMHAWQDLNETGRLSVGTTTELDVITNGFLQRITPQQFLSSFSPSFDTTSSSPNVDITDNNITDVTTFDSVFFYTPVSVGGLILSGLYPISISLGTHKYRIVAKQNATASVTGGGTVPSFTTVSGSATVSVTLADHGLSAGDTINFPIPTTVGGVTILGTYIAVSITSTSVFTIVADQTASSSTSVSMNSGNAEILYDITLGPTSSGTGYGIGPYGDGGYGTGTTTGNQTGTPINARDWTSDNWSDYLLTCPTNGGIYYWKPNGGFQNVQLAPNAPAFNGGIFVAMPAQILVAWGSTSTQNIGVDQDPLLIKWSDQLDFQNWTPSTETQAGSYRIPTGSKIVGGLQGPQSALIWTDLDVWAMQYVGYPLVFGFNKIGASCGLISSHGAAQLGGIVYWMGMSNFFALTGSGATPIPCPIWDEVFQDLDTTNAYKCRAAANTVFNEVWWFYPSLSGGTGENDSYVKLNVVEGSWDYGPLARSAWIDQSVLGNPIGASPTGLIYQHEEGEDADGQPINWSFTTGYWTVGDGQNIAFVDWFLPDMRFGTVNGPQTASVQIQFHAQYYPGGSVTNSPTYTFTQNTPYLNPRIRGRQIAMTVSGNDIGSFVRLGLNRYRWAPDGKY